MNYETLQIRMEKIAQNYETLQIRMEKIAQNAVSLI